MVVMWWSLSSSTMEEWAKIHPFPLLSSEAVSAPLVLLATPKAVGDPESRWQPESRWRAIKIMVGEMV